MYKNPYLMDSDHWLNEATDHWFSVYPPVDPAEGHEPISGDKWFLGMHHTEETKKRISEKQKINMLGKKNALGHKKTQEAKERSKRWGANNGRAINILVDGVVYNTRKEAIEKTPYSEYQLRNKVRFPRVKQTSGTRVQILK